MTRLTQLDSNLTRSVAVPLLLLAVAICLSTPAKADTAPNPGGSTVLTNSTTASVVYSDTAITESVNDYSTTLLALLNGTTVYSQTFLAPFSDPTVAAAIATADAILSGDGATFGSPSLLSSTSALQSSIVTPPSEPSYTCSAAEAAESTFPAGTTDADTVTTTTTFGPASIAVGDCQQESFAVLAGQTDINVNTDLQFTIPVETVTTNTYLDSATYEIAGTKTLSPGVTPEPASVELVLSGLGALGWLRRRRVLSSQR